MQVSEMAMLRSQHTSVLSESDPVRAIEGHRSLAEKGSSQAMLRLAWAYQKGIGVPADWDQAEYWYRRAFDAGPDRDKRLVTYYFGSFYLARKDFPKANEWFSVGAAMAFGPSINCLGRMYRDGLGVERRVDRARELFEQAAALGNLIARRNLVRLFMSGRLGLPGIFHGIRLLMRFTAEAISWSRHLRDEDFMG